MKKRILLIVTILALGITACDSETKGFFNKNNLKENSGLQLTDVQTQRKEEMEKQGVYLYFDSLSEEEKEIYLRICTGIERYEQSEFVLATFESKEECKEAEERVRDIYRYLVYEQPQYFWVNVSQYKNVVWTKDDEYQLGMKLEFIMEKEEAEQKKKDLEIAADKIVAEAREREGTFEQVLYVYDSILQNTKYDHALAEGQYENELERSAYGCLIQCETVCSGYTLAFNMMMQKLGYPCGVEFDQMNMAELNAGHVWNYAQLDGEYYYFDLTWDDTGFESDGYRQYFDYSHQYFGITRKELPHVLADKVLTPECNGRKYNYFVYNNLNMETYDFTTAKEMILRQKEQGYAVLRFDSHTELLNAIDDLVEDGRIYDILPHEDEIRYLPAESNQHLYLMF